MLNVFRDLQKIVSGVLARIIIPLIPVHIAGLFAGIAAEGRLFATIKMFASLFVIILICRCCISSRSSGWPALCAAKTTSKA